MGALFGRVVESVRQNRFAINAWAAIFEPFSGYHAKSPGEKVRKGFTDRVEIDSSANYSRVGAAGGV